jgi:hydrogenase maturation protein HypF
VTLKEMLPPLLAVGAHLKNTVAISRGRDVILSQHIGDLETAKAFFAFQKVIQDLLRLYEVKPQAVVCDAHPDYLSSQHARELGLPVVEVFHHHAHMAACLAENELEGEVLGVTWDGAGYGEDGAIWGGEFLAGDAHSYRRVATFRPFRLAGGERAMKEPRRSALGLLFEMEGATALERPWPFLEGLSERERRLLAQMLARGSNSPLTSSCGRLFDAVAALLSVKTVSSFEGQAAMMVEFAVQEGVEDSYPISLLAAEENQPLVFDWEPLVRAILRDREQGVAVGVICARFHNALADLIVEVAQRVGLERVALSGGCFQNRYLTERTFHRLQEAGFRPFTHQRVPPNDGGIALGQIVVGATKVA